MPFSPGYDRFLIKLGNSTPTTRYRVDDQQISCTFILKFKYTGYFLPCSDPAKIVFKG